jgi:hypothetical protein
LKDWFKILKCYAWKSRLPDKKRKKKKKSSPGETGG